MNNMNKSMLDNANFKRWFGESKVVDEDGEPLVVYHGTTHDFDSFEPDRGTIGNAVGIGYYFTTSADDASINYAGIGADLTNNIEGKSDQIKSQAENMDANELVDLFDIDISVAEEIENGDNEELLETLSKRLATKKLKGEHDGAVIPAFIKMENPFDMSSDEETIFAEIDWEYYEDEAKGEIDRGDYDEDWEYEDAIEDLKREKYYDDYNPEIEGNAIDIIDKIVSASNSYNDVNIEELETLKNKFTDEEARMTPKDFFNALKETMLYATNDEGELVNSEIIREGLEDYGFDGIIQDAYNEFGQGRKNGMPMEGIEYGDLHYIVFEPTHIKSAIGNSGMYDPNNPDIIMRKGGEVGYFNQWKKSDLSKSMNERNRSNLFRIYNWIITDRIDEEKLSKNEVKMLDYLIDATSKEGDVTESVYQIDVKDFVHTFSNDIDYIVENEDITNDKELKDYLKAAPRETRRDFERAGIKSYENLMAFYEQSNDSNVVDILSDAKEEDIVKYLFFTRDGFFELEYWLKEEGFFKVKSIRELYESILDKGAVLTEEAEEAQMDLFSTDEDSDDEDLIQIKNEIETIKLLLSDTTYASKEDIKQLKDELDLLETIAIS
jgi:hypothetical protein